MALDIGASLLDVVMVLLTLSALSYLWKISDFFLVGCNIAVGFDIANRFFQIMPTIYSRTVQPLLNGQWILIVPLLIGLITYPATFRRFNWLGRYASSMIIGAGTAVMLTGVIQGMLFGPIETTLNRFFQAKDAFLSFSGILTLLGTFCVIGYFIYTRPSNRPLGMITKIGRLFLFWGIGTQIAATLAKVIATVLGALLPLIDILILQWL